MSKINIESFYRATILQPILSTDVASDASPLVIKVSKTPSLSSGLLTISPNTDNEEIVYYSAKNDTNLTISITKRAISSTASALSVDGTDWNVTERKKSHSNLDSIRGDISNLHINQALTSEGGVITGELTFGGTSAIGLNLKQLTTAQRDAITAVNGSLIYNTTTGTVQKYEGGTWTDVASGSTPNATETVAGKVELATLAEVNAGTDTGDSGATNVVIPSVFQSAINYFFGNKKATSAEAISGTEDTKYVTASKVNDFYVNKKASYSQAIAGTEDINYSTPSKVKDFFTSAISTTAQALAGINDGTIITPLKNKQVFDSSFTALASDILLAQSNSYSIVPTGAYTKLKEFSCGMTGTYRIKFTLTGGPGITVYGKIYKNGVAVGTERSVSGAIGTFSEDLSFSASDLIQIYCYKNGAGSNEYVYDSKVFASAFPTQLIPVVNI